MGFKLENARFREEDVKISVDSDSSSSTTAQSSFRQLDDAFLQTQTRIWLGEVLKIRLDEELIISELLADGELLFEVSRVVWRLLLTKHMELRRNKAYKNEPFASKKRSGRYMPYSNVDSFLKISKILGLTGIDLFSPSDVVEKKNTRRVCMCIRSFSMKARSKNLNVPDFDVVTYTIAMPTDMVGCIRKSLELYQQSLQGSCNYELQNCIREKFKLGDPIEPSAKAFDSCSEGSDVSENNCVILQSDLSSINCLYGSASHVNSDLEESQASPTVTTVTGMEHLSTFDTKSMVRNENEFESPFSTRLLHYPHSQNLEHDHSLSNFVSPSSIDLQMTFRGREFLLANGFKLSKENTIFWTLITLITKQYIIIPLWKWPWMVKHLLDNIGVITRHSHIWFAMELITVPYFA